MSTMAPPSPRRDRVTPESIESVAAREAELEQKIAERDSLDDRLEAARQTREQLEADLEGQRHDALQALVTAKIRRENAQSEYNGIALSFFPAMRVLDECDRSYQDAWRVARAAGCTDLGVKEAPLRVPVDMIPRPF
jgi:hypothetical protein